MNYRSRLEILSVMHPPNDTPLPVVDAPVMVGKRINYLEQERAERDRIEHAAEIERKLAQLQVFKTAKETEV